jgi:hypothetical protein
MADRTCPILTSPATDLAYWAGLIDGEGHIGIREVRRADRGVNYQGRFSLRMSDRGIIVAFAEAFDLTVSDRTYSNAISTCALSVTEASCGSAARVVAILLPYLRLKHRQAELVIQLEREKRQPGLRTRSSGQHAYKRDGQIIMRERLRTGQEHLDRWRGYYLEVKGLNKPGRDGEAPAQLAQDDAEVQDQVPVEPDLSLF